MNHVTKDTYDAVFICSNPFVKVKQILFKNGLLKSTWSYFLDCAININKDHMSAYIIYFACILCMQIKSLKFEQ